MSRVKNIIKFIKIFFKFSETEAKNFASLLLLFILIISLYYPFCGIIRSNNELSERDKFLLDSFRTAEVILIERKAESEGENLFENPREIKEIRLQDEGFFGGGIEKIKQRNDASSNYRQTMRDGNERKKYFQKNNQNIIPFNINKADTAELMQIKGIGSVLAKRIIHFRDKLGGFVSLNQLYEVYYLDSAVVNTMKDFIFIEEKFVPVRIKINTVNEVELAQHPYISFKLARGIIVYRDQHDGIHQINDLYKILLLDTVLINRIIPYLSIEDSY